MVSFIWGRIFEGDPRFSLAEIVVGAPVVGKKLLGWVELVAVTLLVVELTKPLLVLLTLGSIDAFLELVDVAAEDDDDDDDDDDEEAATDEEEGEGALLLVIPPTGLEVAPIVVAGLVALVANAEVAAVVEVDANDDDDDDIAALVETLGVVLLFLLVGGVADIAETVVAAAVLSTSRSKASVPTINISIALGADILAVGRAAPFFLLRLPFPPALCFLIIVRCWDQQSFRALCQSADNNNNHLRCSDTLNVAVSTFCKNKKKSFDGYFLFEFALMDRLFRTRESNIKNWVKKKKAND